MTNRSKSAKKPRLRFLDLSFEAREEGKRGGLDNGKRPHGGYRGCKKHPPTPFAQEKSRDFHRKLRDDIDKLFEEEFLEVHGTPSWTIEANREITHSGESPLFLHRFMSPTKDENQFVRLSKSAFSNPNKCQPPLSRDGVTYYRPNRTHQYLTATELKNQSQNEVNLKYGRPTRTTLLRARQRTNSAPVNSYEIRRENMKREEELRTSSVYTNPKEFLQEVHASSTNGETFHSFITGARYNRAHCIDAKSLTLYGVYMPRNNPNACFVTGANKLRDIYDIPSAPPDSPRSDVDEAATPMTPRRPTTAPGYGRRPTTAGAAQPKQAWGDGDYQADKRVYEELIFWPTGLSVKGRSLGVNLKRTNSMPRLDARLPSVQGVSVDRMRKSRDPVEETSLINQPPPSPMATSVKDGSGDKTTNITQEKAKQAEEVKKEAAPKKAKPILVDRSVNVPSVSGESHQWNDEPFIKVSACAVPQAKSTSDSGSVKAVSFKKNEDEDEKEPETSDLPERETDQVSERKTEEKNQQVGEDETTTSKEVDAELPSLTDGASIEARVASSAQDTDPLPTTPEGNDLTIDTLSNQSQENETSEEKRNESAQENSANIDNMNVDKASVTFFITEDDENKKTKNVEENVMNTVAQVSGNIQSEEEPSVGHADQMDIPQVTIEEASVSGESEGVNDLETLEGSGADNNNPGNNPTEDVSESQKSDNSQVVE